MTPTAPDNAPPLIIVVGPTATGKTSLALRLARTYDGEVIGADAYQIYRSMDIGTAKPCAEELGDVRHHLLDVVNPDQHFDAHEYVKKADEAIEQTRRRGKTAIVAGGTGLYIRTLVRGLAQMPGANTELRESLAQRAESEGNAVLYAELTRVDPEYAERIEVNDLVRIIRALEVRTLSGRTITEVHAEHARQPDRYPTLWLGLDPGREELRARIAARTEIMFEMGFVDEVRRLLDAGYGPGLPPMKALGYRAVCQHLACEIDLDEAKRLTMRDTARYAKRQRNWFRHELQIERFPSADVDVDAIVKQFLTNQRVGQEKTTSFKTQNPGEADR